jgi:hypothetical protein
MKYFGHSKGNERHALDLATAGVALHDVEASLRRCTNLGDVRAPYTDAILDLKRRVERLILRLDDEFYAVTRGTGITECGSLMNSDGSVESAIAVLTSRLEARK